MYEGFSKNLHNEFLHIGSRHDALYGQKLHFRQFVEYLEKYLRIPQELQGYKDSV